MNIVSFYKIYYRHRVAKANFLRKLYLFFVVPIRYLVNIPFFPKKMNLGRTSKQCRERWHNHLNPDICKEPWTEAEDEYGDPHLDIYGILVVLPLLVRRCMGLSISLRLGTIIEFQKIKNEHM